MAFRPWARCSGFCPERDPHPHLYEALDVILENLHDPRDAGELFVRFEIAVLNDLGFGLDLAECAATGTPRRSYLWSRRNPAALSAVRQGRPMPERLLALPSFLADGGAADYDSPRRCVSA